MKKHAAGFMLVPVLVLAGLAGAPRDALARRELAAVRACTTISTDVERLACYDRALGVERTERAGEAQGARAAHNEPRPAARRESAAEPRPPAPRPAAVQTRTARAKQAQESTQVEVTVVQVRRAPRTEEVAFITKDGQVWREMDDKHVMFPRPPFRAVISPGALGSHFLTPDGEHIDIRVDQQ